MVEEIYYKAKTVLRPLTSRRRLLEQAKYWRTPILSPEAGNALIGTLLDKPCAIGKIGSSEMGALRHYWANADASGHCESWSYHPRTLYRIAGVYPPQAAIFSRFCKEYEEALTHFDVLAVWFNWGEKMAIRRFASNASLIALRALDPIYHQQPWTQRLTGRRVLIISPFAETVESQYARREQVWQSKPGMLPSFDLVTIRSPLSAFLTDPQYTDWFVALDAMRERMSAVRFDVAIVGAGAWSLPLVAHAKMLGASAIHLGGGTQLLFGIQGGRWESQREISCFRNDAWVRPSLSETPVGVKLIEGGCYW
jgi:hypothetical protein